MKLSEEELKARLESAKKVIEEQRVALERLETSMHRLRHACWDKEAKLQKIREWASNESHYVTAEGFAEAQDIVLGIIDEKEGYK